MNAETPPPVPDPITPHHSTQETQMPDTSKYRLVRAVEGSLPTIVDTVGNSVLALDSRQVGGKLCRTPVFANERIGVKVLAALNRDADGDDQPRPVPTAVAAHVIEPGANQVAELAELPIGTLLVGTEPDPLWGIPEVLVVVESAAGSNIRSALWGTTRAPWEVVADGQAWTVVCTPVVSR